jgi:hypothetical protein
MTSKGRRQKLIRDLETGLTFWLLTWEMNKKIKRFCIICEEKVADILKEMDQLQK